MNSGSILRFLALALVALGSACTLGDAKAPPLSGPSELGLSFAMSASPDVLSQDGVSQALVAVTAYDSTGQPARNVQIRAEIEVNGVITDFGSISARSIVTDNNGRATITYTAPAAPIVSVDSGTRVTIRMTPVNGNFADAVARMVAIRLVPPGVIGAGSGPVAAFTVSPLPKAFTPVTFDGSTSKAGASPIVSYGWNFGDGSIGSGQTAIHQYSSQGAFSVTLTVMDNNGFTGSSTQFVAVGPGTAPTAGFSFSPADPRVDQEIVFNGGASTPGAGHTVVGYDWNFGSGNGRSGVLVTKAYDTAGTYPVVLTVTDEAGQTGSQVQVVTVTASSQTASFTSSPTSPHPGTVVNFTRQPATTTRQVSVVPQEQRALVPFEPPWYIEPWLRTHASKNFDFGCRRIRPRLPSRSSRNSSGSSKRFTATAGAGQSRIFIVRLALREALSVRHTKLQEAIRAAGLDGMVITHLPNLFYLTNFLGSAGIAVVIGDRLHLIVDFRYGTAVRELWASPYGCPDAEIVPVDRSYDETLAALIRKLQPARLGIEGANLSTSRCYQLAKALGASVEVGTKGPGADPSFLTLVSTDEMVERLRIVKDAHEIEMLRRGALLLSAVALDVLRDAKPGVTEHEAAAKIDWRIKSAGFERCSFETIVASGPNAALPHAHAGDRVLQTGDLVVLDFGGVYGGYCVDLTRTVALGEPDAEQRRVYDAVLEAQSAAIAAVRPGTRAGDIDAAARGTLGRHKLAEAFGHSTGHGLGVEIHEAPRVGPRREAVDGAPPPPDDAIDRGMVFTIEPGAYLPGWGGVRIEDDVLVTSDGVEVLTNVPRELRAG